MQILEKLYQSASEHLDHKPRNWHEFVADFRLFFGAHAIIYKVTFDEKDEISNFELIVSSAPKAAKEYVRRKLFRQNHFKEGDFPNLEPHRRSDQMDDEEFRQFGEVTDFFIENGIFYLMMAPAYLGANSFLALAAWRSEEEGDFSDLDKLRLGIFMRYLMALVIEKDFLVFDERKDIEAFAKRYKLTASESDILKQLLEGKTLRDISAQSERSYGTVRWHTRNLLEKCQVTSQKNLLNEFYQLIKN